MAKMQRFYGKGRQKIYSKYGNKSCKCPSKHQHQSVWEADVCNYLSSLVKSKRILYFTTQKSIDITVKGKTVCTHILESKGFSTDVWQLKRKLTKALYKKIPYVTVYRGQLDLIDKEILC